MAPRQQIVRGGLILDPGQPVAEAADILIADGRIVAVLPPGQAAPADAEVIDAHDRILIPGLVNAEVQVMVGLLYFLLPVAALTLIGTFQNINPRLEVAAIALGASPRRAVFDITLPLARTGIIAGALMAFVLSFDEVAVSLFLADAFSQTLPIVLVAEMRTNLNLTVAAISTVFATATVLILLLLDRTVGLDNVIGQGMYRG